MVSAQRGIMTFYQVLSPLCIFFISFVSASCQNNHRYSGKGDKILSCCEGHIVCVIIHPGWGESPGLGTGHLGSAPAPHCLPSPAFQKPLSSARCQAHEWFTLGKVAATDNPPLYILVSQIHSLMDAGMIWKHKWA